MSSGKHIVILTPGFPDGEEDQLCIPPLQLFLLDLTKAMPHLRVSVVAFQYPYRTDHFKWNGVDVYPCGGANKRWPLRKRTWSRAEAQIKQLHSEQPISVLHALWLDECALIGKKMSDQIGAKLLITLMGQDAKSDNSYLNKIEWKQLHTIAISRYHDEQLFQSTGQRASQIIPWGIDSALLNENAARPVDVIGVGSFITLKQYDQFLEVIQRLHTEKSDLKACLVGYGKQRDALEAQSAKLGLQNVVEFTGLLPRNEVLSRMRESKVLLHPSNYESYGFVFAEALQQGASIVSMGVGIAAESSRWKIASDVDSMASATRELLDSQTDFSSQVIFPLEETVKLYCDLYGC